MNCSLYRPKLLWLFAFFLVLAGCAGLPRSGPAEGGFHLRGTLGVVDGEQSFSARFLWQQDRDAFLIDLWGPLGQGRVQLAGDRRRLELREGDGTLISRGPPQQVMARHLGWSLPLDVLPQWVRGRPAQGLPVQDERRDENGRLTGFRQLGWQVTLERYRAVPQGVAGSGAGGEAGAGVSLPHRVTASRDGYRVRLAIGEWRL